MSRYSILFATRRRAWAVLFAVLSALLFALAALPAQAASSGESAGSGALPAPAALAGEPADSAVPLAGSGAPDAAAVRSVLDKVAAYQMDALSAATPGYGNEWAIFGLARAGLLPNAVKAAYTGKLQTDIAPLMDANGGKLDANRSTENARVILALTAIGLNASDFAGRDLTAALADRDYVAKQGVNGVTFALLALDCGNYKIPALPAGSAGTQTTRGNLVSALLDGQTAGSGGWALTGTTPDPDVTAMALIALAPYAGKGDAGVDLAIQKGTAALSARQNAQTGAFGGGIGGASDSAESTAQAIIALDALGVPIDDTRFVKNGQTAYDALLTFYTDTATDAQGAGVKGAFRHLAGGAVNAIATEQGLLALVSQVRGLTALDSLFEIGDAQSGGSGGSAGSGGDTYNYYYSGATTNTTSNSTTGNETQNQTNTTNNTTTTTTTTYPAAAAAGTTPLPVAATPAATPAAQSQAADTATDTATDAAADEAPTTTELKEEIDALRAQLGETATADRAETIADAAAPQAAAPERSFTQTPSLRAIIGYLGAAGCAALVGLFLGLRRRAVVLLAGVVCAAGVSIWCFAPGFDPGSYTSGGGAAASGASNAAGTEAIGATDAGGAAGTTLSGSPSSKAAAGSASSATAGSVPAGTSAASSGAGAGTGSGNNAGANAPSSNPSAAPNSGTGNGNNAGAAAPSSKPSATTNSGSSTTSSTTAPPAPAPAPQHLVTLSIDCTTLLGNMDKLSAAKRGLVPAGGALMTARAASFTPGESVYDVLARECRASGVPMDSSNTPLYNSPYVKGIGNLYEFDAGPTSGWLFSVNGAFPSMSCGQAKLHDGDVIAWRYTCNLGADIGAAGAAQG